MSRRNPASHARLNALPCAAAAFVWLIALFCSPAAVAKDPEDDRIVVYLEPAQGARLHYLGDDLLPRRAVIQLIPEERDGTVSPPIGHGCEMGRHPDLFKRASPQFPILSSLSKEQQMCSELYTHVEPGHHWALVLLPGHDAPISVVPLNVELGKTYAIVPPPYVPLRIELDVDEATRKSLDARDWGIVTHVDGNPETKVTSDGPPHLGSVEFWAFAGRRYQSWLIPRMSSPRNAKGEVHGYELEDWTVSDDAKAESIIRLKAKDKLPTLKLIPPAK